ncbi:MAG: NAD(P)H-hydrate dehydratase [Bacteroidota bacterium]
MRLANAHQIREADRIQIHERNYPSLILMENAALRMAQSILRDYPQQKAFGILVGPGNNGGDGLVIARQLHQAGMEVQILLSHDPTRFEGDARINYEIIGEMPIPITLYGQEPLQVWLDSFSISPLLIDGLLGTGIQSALRDPVLGLIDALRKSNPRILAIDLPSGLDASTGEAINTPLQAEKTYTFQLPKVCHFVTPASLFCGEIEVIDIGLWPDVIDALDIKRTVLTHAHVEQQLKQVRHTAAHKGDFGHVLVVGGSRNMTGAISLTTQAALRAGGGLVTSLVPTACRDTVLHHAPEAMCVDVSGDYLGKQAVEVLDQHLQGKTAVVIGPGMGQEIATADFLREILPMVQVPLLLDADALNILSQYQELWASLPDATVLTPHPGEMRRLLGVDTVNQRRLEAAERLAQDKAVTVVLKGAGTIVAGASGHTYVNTTGNPGMAKGGSGDVLSGIIGSLMGQGYGIQEAAGLGVFLHGRAGDAAADHLGQTRMTALDIIHHL